MYKLMPIAFGQSQSNCVQRISDSAIIPFSEENKDYEDYLEWLSKGNVPEPADREAKPNPKEQRLAAYRDESDPIFFKVQRGEATIDQWIAKIEEIKKRFPEETV